MVASPTPTVPISSDSTRQISRLPSLTCASAAAVIHPAVKSYILQEIEAEREAGKIDAFFVEAALLIEEGYGELLDELWYIFAQKEVRRKRLMQDRGYSEEKVEQIFASQLSEEEFRCHCKVVIDNSADLGDTYRQIDERLKEAGLSR